jgi:hypothetical protein
VLKSLPVTNDKKGADVDPSMVFKPSLKVDIELLGWKSVPVPEALQDLKLLDESKTQN